MSLEDRPLDDPAAPVMPRGEDTAFLPRSLDADRPGRLIVIEGPDGSGRSTQISLLSEWLEWNGFAVQTMGLKRSQLLGKDLDDLMRSNQMRHRTRLLLYATDFYDQLEHQVVPALRAGFVVLADRYVLSLICRSLVRGIEADYLDNLFQYAPQPDLRLRLQLDPEDCFHRLFQRSRALSHHEFGGDLLHEEDLYTSFIDYQGQMRDTFADVGERLGYTALDAGHSVQQTNLQLRTHIAELLGIPDTHYEPSDRLRTVWNLS